MTSFPRLAGTALALAFCSFGAAAQAPGFSASVTPLFMADSDLDRGGEVGMTSWQVSGSGNWVLGRDVRAGVQLRYEQQDWSFASPAAFGGSAPWETVTRYGVGVPINYVLGDGWSLNVTPRADWSGEEGADQSEALGLGLTAGAVKMFGPGKMLGFGLAVFDDIDDTTFFPFILVDWKFDNGWRIANPLAVGPSGPAGLELSYDLGGGWDLGAGAAYRSTRFRLATDNRLAANGAAEVSSLPAFVRAGYASRDGWRVDLYAGAFFGSELNIDDKSGNRVAEDKFGNAPSVAANFSIRF